MSERWNVKDLERFWSRVGKTECCWVWTGCRLPSGYGQFRVGGRIVRAHRFSVESRRVLARRFGVSLSLISAVRNRRVWL